MTQQAQALAKPGVSIQIEVENLDELRRALDAGAKADPAGQYEQ